MAEYDILINIANLLGNGPFRDAEGNPQTGVDDPEGSLTMTLSKKLCLELCSSLINLHRDLERECEVAKKRKRDLVLLLNRVFAIRPVQHDELNRVIRFEGQEHELRELSKQSLDLKLFEKESLGGGISVVSLIGTITAALAGDRMLFVVDRDGENYGRIERVCWNSETRIGS